MKNPFMVLNYGSAIQSIVDSVVKHTSEELYSKINEYYKAKHSSEADVNYNPKVDKLYEELVQIENDLNRPLDSKKINIKAQIDSPIFLKSGRLKLENVDEVLSNYLQTTKKGNETFGDALRLVFESKYGEFIKLTKTTNELLTFQFRIAKKVLDKRIKQRYENKITDIVGKDASKKDRENASKLVAPISEKEMYKMVQELSDLFPVLNSALNTKDGKPAPILIAGKDRVFGKDDVEMLGNIANTGGLRIKGMVVQHGAVAIYKLVEAYSAGAVIPIHFFDGSVQAKLLKKMTALGVHDANFFGIGSVVDGTKLYNEIWTELNKEYHLIHELMQSVVRTFKSDKIDNTELNEVLKELNDEYSEKNPITGEMKWYKDTIQEQITSLADTEKRAEEARAKIFAKELYIEHAYFEGMDESGGKVTARYEYKPNVYKKKITNSNSISKITDILKKVPNNSSKDRKINNRNLNYAKATERVLKEDVLKAADDYLPEVLISNEEAKQIDKLNDKYIQKYGIKVKFGKEFMYNPEDNSITIIPEADAKDRAVYVAHEIKHAITYKWLQDGKHRKQYEYLAKAIKRLRRWTPKENDIDQYILYQRMQYAAKHEDEFTQIAELVAILSSEPNVRNTFIKQFPQKEVSTLRKILEGIRKVLGMLGKIDTKYVIGVVDSIVEDAMNTEIKTREFLRDSSNKNSKVIREELYKDGKVAAYASIGKAKIEGMLGWTQYNGNKVGKDKVYRTISMVWSNERGLGYGDAMLGHVINKYGKEDILLEALPMDDTTTLDRLVKWYQKYGFEVVPTDNGQVIMLRKGDNESAESNSEDGIIDAKDAINKIINECKG